MKFKVSCDLDGVICDFYTPYLERFGNPKKDSIITKHVNGILKCDKDFWLNLPVIHQLNFEVKQYTTARVIPKQWIKEYLQNNNFPKAPIYQIMGYGLSKVPKIKMGGCNVHIDDSLKVFIDCNLNGVPCLLMDSIENRRWGPIGRIYTLDINEIEECYHLFLDTVFPYFKELIR